MNIFTNMSCEAWDSSHGFNPGSVRPTKMGVCSGQSGRAFDHYVEGPCVGHWGRPWGHVLTP